MTSNKQLIAGICILLMAFFISSISQVLLKKAALRNYKRKIDEYINPFVIGAYLLLFLTTLMSVFAYKTVPISLGSVLETTGYIYIIFWGIVLFGEKINKRKIIAIILIVLGTVVSVLGG